MKTTDDCVPEVEQAECTADIRCQMVVRRILLSVFYGILFPVVGVLMCSYISACCRGETGDSIYGGDIPFAPLFTVLCYALVLGISGLLANFNLGTPKRFVREVIAWLLLLYAAFGLHYLAAYLYYGDGLAFCAVVRGFCQRTLHFSCIMIPVSLLLIGTGLGIWLGGWVLKRILARKTKQGKPIKTPWLFKKVEGFIERNPSLIVKSTREYLCLWARYAIWGTLLSLLFLEAMIAFCFAMGTQSLGRGPDPAYDPSFELVSFEGERFGRVLSGEVERKKLDQPIGVIDELMLQTEGNPARRFMCMYGQKYLGNISDEEANVLAEETCAALQKLIGVELKNAPLVFRDGFRKCVFSDQAYAQVKWDDHFFQKGKVLRLDVGLDVRPWHDPCLKATEVMGHKIGEPIGEDRKPRTPFWKFERVVPQCSRNQIADGFHAVHDVSALKLEDAVKELEEARKAVEELHGIKMFKMVDGDDVKQYDYYGDDVCVSVKLEYLKEKQIRYSVLATGDWAQQIHAIPAADSPVQQSNRHDTLVFVLCMAVFAACGVRLVHLIRRKKKESNENAG